MPDTADTTEARIRQAAQRVFVRDGFDGARMQDIADEAGINKALLHYYFRSKDKLFALIFEEKMGQFLDSIWTVLGSDGSLHDKIRRMVELDITQLSQEPVIPLFIFHEISQNPELVRQKLRDKNADGLFAAFARQVDDEARRGLIRPVDPQQLFANLLSLTVFPFVAKPMLQGFMTLNEPAFAQFIEDRKQQAADFLIHALRP
ncbi:TetR/AcrR family transcriptional regulator [Fibrella aquatilis]|uniref:TetR/AcrR family transcriptional regulator n=1 Tax=Fibrella aquatilis TaxID=2817059 RepID=A0A939JZZ8_9BACT|nr:TetR/AcrR family transcriptional regulator [Fibrella aquatilis]MBO0931943.1 TetR/AcrR family transcriptional regulator [Fibrella aquatilis]